MILTLTNKDVLGSELWPLLACGFMLNARLQPTCTTWWGLLRCWMGKREGKGKVKDGKCHFTVQLINSIKQMESVYSQHHHHHPPPSFNLYCCLNMNKYVPVLTSFCSCGPFFLKKRGTPHLFSSLFCTWKCRLWAAGGHSALTTLINPLRCQEMGSKWGRGRGGGDGDKEAEFGRGGGEQKRNPG